MGREDVGATVIAAAPGRGAAAGSCAVAANDEIGASAPPVVPLLLDTFVELC